VPGYACIGQHDCPDLLPITGGVCNTGSYIHETGAIHQGFGAANRLAVIMRGSEYICYINGQFVGIYRDAGSQDGPVGLYASSDQSEDAPIAAFTDFAIYPL
jgi:hypothetical protein